MKRSIWSMPSSDRPRWALMTSAKLSSSATFWMLSFTEVRGFRISWAIVAAMRPIEASFSCWTSFRLASSIRSRAWRSWPVISLKLRARSPTSSPEVIAMAWEKSPFEILTVPSTSLWRGRVIRRARSAAPAIPRRNPPAAMSSRTFWTSRNLAYMGSRDMPILTEAHFSSALFGVRRRISTSRTLKSRPRTWITFSSESGGSSRTTSSGRSGSPIEGSQRGDEGSPVNRPTRLVIENDVGHVLIDLVVDIVLDPRPDPVGRATGGWRPSCYSARRSARACRLLGEDGGLAPPDDEENGPEEKADKQGDPEDEARGDRYLEFHGVRLNPPARCP